MLLNFPLIHFYYKLNHLMAYYHKYCCRPQFWRVFWGKLLLLLLSSTVPTMPLSQAFSELRKALERQIFMAPLRPMTTIFLSFLFKLYFIDYAMTVLLISPFLAPSNQHALIPHTIPPPLFMSMGHAYKFFGYSLSYTVLYTPMAIM